MNRYATEVSNARALTAFAIGTLFFGLAFFHRVSPSVMTTELMRDFSVNATALGTLSAWYFYAYASIQLPVGILNDRFGPRTLMSITVAVCALGSIGFAASESLLTASFFRALIGAAVAFAFVSTLTIASYWFSAALFATLAGVTQTVGMFGGMLGQAPLRHAVEQFGWRATVGTMGIVAVVLAILIFCIVPRQPQHVTAEKLAHNHNTLSGVVAVLSNPQSWACAGIGFGMTATMLSFAGLWAVPWMSSVFAYPVSSAAGVVSLLFLGWAIGAPLAGWLSDYSKKRKPVILVSSIFNIVFFAIILFAGFSTVSVLSVLFFMLGVSGSTMTIAFGSIRELNSPQHSATAIGLLNMFVVGSGAVMQPLIGWLLDLGWDGQIVDGARIYSSAAYTTAFTVLFGSSLLALGCALMLRETNCQQRQPPQKN